MALWSGVVLQVIMPAIGRAQEMEKAGNSKIAYYCYLYAVIKVCVLQAFQSRWLHGCSSLLRKL